MKTALNGGILGKGMQLRMDMDVYARGLLECDNFVLNALGGAQRRHGLSYVLDALDASSRLYAYVYSPSLTLLIEVGHQALRVISPAGVVLCELQDTPWTSSDLQDLRVGQLKKSVILTHPSYYPRELTPASANLEEWSISKFALTHEPWRTYSLQDSNASMLLNGMAGTVDFGETQDMVQTGDVLKFAYTVDSASYDINAADGYYPSALGALCGGKWTLQISGKRGCSLKVQRRYVGGSWHDIGTSISNIDSPSNNVLSSDETDAPCYLRVQLSDFESGWDDWSQSLVLDTWTRTLRLAVTGASTASKATVELARPIDDYTWTIFESGTVFILVHDGTTYSITLDYAGYEYLRFTLPSSLELTSSDEVVVKATQASGDYLNKARWYPEGTSFMPNQYDVFEGTIVTLQHWKTKFKQLINGVWQSVELTSESSVDCAVVLRNESESLYAGYPAGWYVLEYGEVYASSFNDMNSAILLDGYLGAVGSGGVSFFVDASINEITDNLPTSEVVTNDWSWSAWREAYGYPKHYTMHQQRVVFASTSSQAQTIWMSKTDDVTSFEVLSEYDDSSIAATLATINESAICWMLQKGTDLCVGTQLGEYVVAAGDGGTSLTAGNATAYPDGYVGASTITPEVVSSDLVVYLTRGGQRVQQFGYSESANGYVSQDITVLCPEILSDGGGCCALAFARLPDPTIYALRNDGAMACCVHYPSQAVNAWYLIKSPRCVISAIAAIPRSEGGDWVFLRTTRTSPDGLTQRHCIELMHDDTDYLDNDITDDGELTTQDFTSSFITTDVSDFGRASTNSLKGVVKMLVAEPTLAGGIEVTADNGETWTPINAGDTVDGWVELNAQSNNKDQRCYGVRVAGNRPLHVLGLKSINS